MNSKLLILIILTLSTYSASAKDLFNRLGVGYTNQFSIDLPSIAVRYYPTKNTNVSTVLGIDSQDGNSQFGFMGKVSRVLLTESHMNFYAGIGVAVISQQLPHDTKTKETKSTTGVEFHGYVGGEFFLPNLDSLGFSFETGISIISISNRVRLKTIGDHPIRAGIIFYL